MSATHFIVDSVWNQLPARAKGLAIAERERIWLKRILNGDYECSFFQLSSGAYVSSAITIDGVRIAMTYKGAAQAALSLASRLPTKAEVDEAIRSFSFDVEPQLVRPVELMAGEVAIETHSQAIDALVGEHRWDKLYQEGKWWLSGAAKGKAINYGWVDADAPVRANGLRLIQDVGRAHNDLHVDYSQTLRVVCDPRPSVPTKRSTPLAIEKATLIPPPPGVPHDTEPSMDVVSATLPTISLKQARAYRRGRAAGAPIWIFIHTAQCSESSRAAENLQSWGGDGVSWHYAIDSDSITASVREDDTAFAAGPIANDLGIHIELAGYAQQSANDWADAFSSAQLDLCARLVADICHRRRIPIERRYPAELRAKGPGIAGHMDARDAWRRTTHGDPGQSFPWERMLSMARGYASLL